MTTLCSRRAFARLIAVMSLAVCAVIATPAAAEDAHAVTVGASSAAPCASATPDFADLLREDQPAVETAAVCSTADVALPTDSLQARLGYCKCGCTTARCHTSADCGGAACLATISCC